MIRPVLVLVLAAFLSGCAGNGGVEAPSLAPSTPATSLVDLRDAVAEVADVQANADADLMSVLDAVRRVDEAVVGVRSVETYDATLAAYPATHGAVEAASTDDLRESLFAVADAVDRARVALASARRALDDPWQVEYLDAEDAVLVEVRSYAEAADRLAQLLQQHWPTYTAIDAELTAFAGRITVERTAQEGVDALAIELDPHLGDLAVAQQQLAQYRQDRAEAADRVNAATSSASEVYASRPEEPTATPDG